jgi:hypothetical protein
MNRRLIIGLTLSAWCLYVASLFLPAADVSLDFNSYSGGFGFHRGGLEQGWEVLLVCVAPWGWIAVVPFIYFIVNGVFFYSAGTIWFHLHGRKSNFYTVRASLSAVASWFAPLFVGGIGVGYFAWTASITLMAVAINIAVNSDESTASLDSEGS